LEGIPSPKTFEFDGIVAAHEALAASAMELPVVGVGIQSRSSGATVYRQRALESSLEGAMMGSVMKELVLGWVRYLAAVQHYEGRRHLMPLTSLDFIQDLQPHLRKWVLNNTAHGTHQENESRDRIEMVVAKAEEAAREMVSCFTKGGSVSSFLRSATPPSSGPKPIELVGLDFNQTCDMFRTEIAAAAESFGRFVSECS
jgi:hypothetical protein